MNIRSWKCTKFLTTSQEATNTKEMAITKTTTNSKKSAKRFSFTAIQSSAHIQRNKKQRKEGYPILWRDNQEILMIISKKCRMMSMSMITRIEKKSTILFKWSRSIQLKRCKDKSPSQLIQVSNPIKRTTTTAQKRRTYFLRTNKNRRKRSAKNQNNQKIPPRSTTPSNLSTN